MSERFVNLTLDNLDGEHLCCAIADKKHQGGVESKKEWLRQRLPEGHVFRKLDEKGKVFIEYAPLETAWVPINGDNYLYIYCLWVSGSFKGKGYASSLLNYCVDDAKKQGKSGVCVLSAAKKKPFLSEKKFMQKFGFETVDCVGEYELLALSFDGTKPRFADTVKDGSVACEGLAVYYAPQCPYIPNCIAQIKEFCENNGIAASFVAVDCLQKAKTVPSIFNNWAVFYNGTFETVHLLNEGYVKKLLGL